MNTLQTILSALTTPNEPLFKLISIPLNYLDVFVVMLFFTTLLNIETTFKRKCIYVSVYGTVAALISFFIPSSYKVFINIFIWPIFIFFILRTTILKSILATILTLVLSSILESILINMFLVFGIDSQSLVQIPLYRIMCMLCIYLILFILSRIIKYFKVNIVIFEHLSLKNKLLLGISLFLIVLVLGLQFYLVIFYSSSMPLIVSSINIVILIKYFKLRSYKKRFRKCKPSYSIINNFA